MDPLARQASAESSAAPVQDHQQSVASALSAKANAAAPHTPQPQQDAASVGSAHSGPSVPLAHAPQKPQGPEHSLGMDAMIKDPVLQGIIKEEMPFKSREGLLDYAQQKLGKASLKEMGQSAVDSLVAKIPVVGKTAAFLTEKNTGNSMRLTALSQNTGANPLAKEMVESLTSDSMHKQSKAMIALTVKHLSAVASHFIPGADTFTSGLAAKAVDAGISAAQLGAKEAIKYAAGQGAREDLKDATPTLAQQEAELSNGKSIKLSSQTALFCLMKYLATPILTGADSQEMSADGKDLLEAQVAKKALIEELGGFADMNKKGASVDKGVNDVLLYLMTNPQKADAFRILVDAANSGEQPSESDVRRFAALTKSQKMPTGMDLTKLLADPQVKSESRNSFNYHNAMLLASGIEKSESFKYSFHEGRALSSLYKSTPPYEPTNPSMVRHQAIGSVSELTLPEAETLRVASARDDIELETATMKFRGQDIEVQVDPRED